jgi:hypothetical protein
MKCGDGAHHKSRMLMAPAVMSIIIRAGALIFTWKRNAAIAFTKARSLASDEF